MLAQEYHRRFHGKQRPRVGIRAAGGLFGFFNTPYCVCGAESAADRCFVQPDPKKPNRDDFDCVNICTRLGRGGMGASKAVGSPKSKVECTPTTIHEFESVTPPFKPTTKPKTGGVAIRYPLRLRPISMFARPRPTIPNVIGYRLFTSCHHPKVV
jgi:hypothetical protein